jgi:hypothetical protein
MNKLTHQQTAESARRINKRVRNVRFKAEPVRRKNKENIPAHPDLKRIYDLCLNNKKYNWDDFIS